MSATTNYQRRPGRGNQLSGYYRLYRGDDHLLQVAFAGFSERYKRFYFRDIQAFVVTPSNAWVVTLSICAIGFILMLLSAFAIGDTVGYGVFGTLAGFFLIATVWQTIAGQSCRCYVRTAVQMELLPSVSSLRRATRLMAVLQPLIAVSQTPLASAESQSPETFSPTP